MNIVHINTTDTEGGAARAAFRLHKGILDAGHTSRMLVSYKTGGSQDVAPLVSGVRKMLPNRLVILLEEYLSLQYIIPWSRGLFDHPYIQSADIVNLHNVHGNYFSPLILPTLTRNYPIVWTLHDMWPLTGHCGYSYDCARWKTGCGACPSLNDYPPLRKDTTGFLWKIKDRVYRRSRLTVVCPSQWLAKTAQESPLLGRFPVHHVPYGVDLKIFRPLRKEMARELLGLPQKTPLLLFAAAYASERRKGADFLRDALHILLQQGFCDIGLITLGIGSESLRFPSEIQQWSLGNLMDETSVAAVYSAADLLVSPSLADNLPNTILESLACGTPVVAFNTGGVAEIVRSMETGYLATYQDANDLATGIQLLLRKSELRARMSRNCREVAEREYSLELQARRYLELYAALIAERSHVVATL